MNTTIAMRLMLLTRTCEHRPQVVGPRTVYAPKTNLEQMRAALHILRCRLVDMGDRYLIVSMQFVVYRSIVNPSDHICPTCYAQKENKYSASNTTHYGVMLHQLDYPVTCGSCGVRVVHESVDIIP